MFYDNYLTKEETIIMKENYSSIIESIDNEGALEILEILEENKCNFINDLIINYLEIFLEKPNIIKTKLNLLKDELGETYMKIIENNLNLLVD